MLPKTFQHEMQVAADNGMLGSLDANRGDNQNGWDTDQFPNDINEITECMMILLQAGGLQGGGINFDAKIRRNSTDPADLFYAHVGGMDIFARGLIIADNILQKSEYKKLLTDRYASYDSGKGKEFEEGKLSLEDLRTYAIENGEPKMISGKQEYIENLINRFI
jgi:xylose isomerase